MIKEMTGNVPFNLKAAGEGGHKNRFWEVERCWNCPNAVIDINSLEKGILKIMEEANFESLRGKALKTDKPMHHQVFRISISGCPNSCSQPQIKDMGVQGQAVPGIGKGCTFCGKCVRSCPDGLISLGEDGPAIDRAGCLNCGRCARACPAGALTASTVGYRVLVGGKLGRRPRLAETAVAFGGDQAVESALKAVVQLLVHPEFAKERLGNIIEKRGIGWFNEKLPSAINGKTLKGSKMEAEQGILA